MKIFRHVCFVLAVTLTIPFFMFGFAYQVARNWFEFGRASAEIANEE